MKTFNILLSHLNTLYSTGENTLSTLGRFVLLVWLFVVLIINSSYTASLTSILTVQQLYSPIKGIETLMFSKDPIGYQQGSFARNYLIEELGIHESRLVPLEMPEDFTRALRAGPSNGGVSAVVDERPYVELFLSTRCEFSIIGPQFTKNGWGFVSLSLCVFLMICKVELDLTKIQPPTATYLGLSTGLALSSRPIDSNFATFGER